MADQYYVSAVLVGSDAVMLGDLGMHAEGDRLLFGGIAQRRAARIPTVLILRTPAERQHSVSCPEAADRSRKICSADVACILA